jgi:hypothetical protein
MGTNVTLRYGGFKWGRVTLVFNDPEFSNGFAIGRHTYFEHISSVFPLRAQHIGTIDLLRLIAACDQLGTWHYMEDSQMDSAAHIGYLVGYLSGPLKPETRAERAVRQQGEHHEQGEQQGEQHEEGA